MKIHVIGFYGKGSKCTEPKRIDELHLVAVTNADRRLLPMVLKLLVHLSDKVEPDDSQRTLKTDMKSEGNKLADLLEELINDNKL